MKSGKWTNIITIIYYIDHISHGKHRKYSQIHRLSIQSQLYGKTRSGISNTLQNEHSFNKNNHYQNDNCIRTSKSRSPNIRRDTKNPLAPLYMLVHIQCAVDQLDICLLYSECGSHTPFIHSPQNCYIVLDWNHSTALPRNAYSRRQCFPARALCWKRISFRKQKRSRKTIIWEAHSLWARRVCVCIWWARGIWKWQRMQLLNWMFHQWSRRLY